MTEDEMAGWHHQLDGHEFVQAPGDAEGQGSLACCSPWSCRVYILTSSVQLFSRVRVCDTMNCSMPGFLVHHHLPKLAQSNVNQVGDGW